MDLRAGSQAAERRTRSQFHGIRFKFDDGYTDFAVVGSKATAEFYAAAQLGEEIPMGVNPLLLSAEKADALREKT